MQGFKQLTRFVCSACLLFFIAACADRQPLIISGGSTMGTTWSVKAQAVEALSADALTAILQAELDSLEALMSTWREDSEISQFNAAPAGCYAVSAATLTVVSEALNISEITGGAFDITVGPLIRLWGFGKRFTGDQVPSAQELAALKRVTGYQQLSLKGEQLCKHIPELQINLSAIAKGYAVDRLAEILAANGVTHYLIEVGGELYAKGQNPAGRPWTIGVERPVSDGRAIMESVTVELRDKGVATSGDYRNYFEKAGKRYSHILNPATAKPVEHQLASVTVLAPTAMLADAWATSLLVLGVDKGMALANQQGLAVLMIAHAGGAGTNDLVVATSALWP